MIQNAFAAQPIRSGTVMLVEDDTVQLDAMVELVIDLGFTPLACTNADEALRHLRERREDIRLLWTDFYMPGTANGGRLAVEAMSVIPGLPIIVTSGVAGTAYRLESGITYVSKPWSLEIMSNLIVRLITSNS